MTEAEAEEFTQALAQVFSGGWRLILHARQQGIPQKLGMSVPQWVESRLGGYVRMGIEERRDAVAELTGNGMSTREIGDVLGVDHGTVIRDRKAGEFSPASPAEPAESEVAEFPEPVAGESSPASRSHSGEQLPQADDPFERDERDAAKEPESFDSPVLDPAEVRRAREEAQRRRAEQEHAEAISRYVHALEGFVACWDTAYHLADDPNREDALAALTDYDRARFLDIEKRISR